MKKIAITFVFLIGLGVNSIAQDGFQFGLEIYPSWKINMTKFKPTSMRTYQGGYGFGFGIPVKYWLNEFTSFNTGIDYEFSAFDGYENGVLVSSFRLNSLHLPLLFNINMSGDWYGMVGSGIVYNLSVRDLNNVTIGTDVTSVTNRVQPYLGLGLNTILEKGKGNLELGVLVRYQVLDIWKNDYKPLESFNSHLISMDLIARYYF